MLLRLFTVSEFRYEESSEELPPRSCSVHLDASAVEGNDVGAFCDSVLTCACACDTAVVAMDVNQPPQPPPPDADGAGSRVAREDWLCVGSASFGESSAVVVAGVNAWCEDRVLSPDLRSLLLPTTLSSLGRPSGGVAVDAREGESVTALDLGAVRSAGVPGRELGCDGRCARLPSSARRSCSV